MAEHPWCFDLSRDEAVRAAEDGRSCPLPTLEECIERQKHAAMTAGVKEGFVKADGEWKRLTDDELRQILMIPKSVSASSAVEHENKGDDMGTKADEQAAAYWAEQRERTEGVTERRPPEPRGGENVTGLRTERVTLEITHDHFPHASALDWPYMVANYFYRNGESVRVVEESHFDDLAQVAMERDAAIRERDALKARVAELESAAKLAPAANAAGGSNHAAPAASGAAGSYWMVRWPDGGDHDIDDELFADEQTARHMAELEDGAVVVELVERHSASGAAGTEVVAWGIANPGNPIFGNQKVWAVRATEEIAKDVYRSCNGWVHFPLYAAPQPAKGWLTAEERKWVEYMSGNCVLPYAGMKCMEAILARSSPPEVVLPPMVIAYDDMDMLKESLAAAGVTVKEVGK